MRDIVFDVMKLLLWQKWCRMLWKRPIFYVDFCCNWLLSYVINYNIIVESVTQGSDNERGLSERGYFYVLECIW